MNLAAPALPRLPRRLQALLDVLPAGSVADVGAGHGALAAHLCAAGRRVVATEAQPGPLAELRANLARWGLAGRVATRLGPELEPLAPHEVDGAVAAGMGGNTLVAIAAAAPEAGLQWVALQCVQRRQRVDEWLDTVGWPVLAADVVEERGHAYATWVLRVGTVQ